ncbi:BA14K family protein [Bradyrhizobium diazoefficiens]|uniref:BA14K family protein n=1 Tax=Bradyrhizobium diazoefficiens TaxID=1355477 RepID=UPI00190AC2AA|nr:BA14K family protein [Bradyrhizobium diazoefficiens]QQO36256.1 BA14K family protein [Bradyrhizobium diazoefficiens]
MTALKALVAATLFSTITITSASAQLPVWAIQNPDTFQAEYPNRDVLNGGAPTPAGRAGMELPDGGAPPGYRARGAYAAMVGAPSSSCARRYRSYDPASATFLGRDGRRHACE